MKEFLKGIALRRKENRGWYDYPEEYLKVMDIPAFLMAGNK